METRNKIVTFVLLLDITLPRKIGLIKNVNKLIVRNHNLKGAFSNYFNISLNEYGYVSAGQEFWLFVPIGGKIGQN